ncbi:MAG TPA: phytanoyl-CoA dioxygenase family protein [Pyrinomonadaceae bacterium]|nr:phytanoyl-CoA dioxygenase family protein [Pyrinomonadaceae bacterium]
MTGINAEQLERYNSDGFLVLEGFVNANECDELRARAEQFVQEFEPADVISIFTTREQSRVADEYFLTSGDKIRCFFEENAFLPDGSLKQSKERSINKIGHALHDLDPVFNKFSRSPKIRELIQDLGIMNPVLSQSMYIFKQPNIGGEVSCHQDSTFLYTEPIDIAGLWFALEDATIENGCLWAIPGGHKRGLKSRWVRSANGGMEFKTLNEEPWPEAELIPLEVTKGSLIVLHGLLPHRSLENRSSKSRHAYTLHVIGGDAYYPADNWLQRSPAMPPRGFD